MVKIITYSQRLFNRMVDNRWYKEEDFFLSIVHHNIQEDDMPKNPMTLNHLFSKFDDVVEDVLGNKAITLIQAEHIVKFARTIPDDVTLHIHCGAGVSRSTAAAKAISEILEEKGIEISEQRLGESYHPNPTVYRLMIDAHNQLKESKS